MPWFKVDDKLHDHRKARAAGRAAMGVWVLAGSWAMDNLTDGFIPKDVLSRWGTRADASRLVTAGLWYVDKHGGEDGWRFHDWARFQPSAAVTEARRKAEADAGIRGNHKRWHEARGITDPDCEYCYRVPDHPPDQVPEAPPEGVPESPPIPPVPVPEPLVEANASTRADVERLCARLADRIERHGVKRPSINKRWHDAARLMLDSDGYTEAQVQWLIDKAQDDEFWRSNILSMPKLREKATQLRLRFSSGPPLTVDDPSQLPPVEESWMRQRP